MIDFKQYILEEGWSAVKKNLPLSAVERIEAIDPTPQKKYGEWLFNNLADSMDNDEDIRKYLEIFIKYKDKHKTDINSLDFGEFVDLVDELKEGGDLKSAAKEGADKIIDNEDYSVFLIKSYEASCQYGRGAKWCVSMKDDKSYWKDYNRHSVFLFIIFKNENMYHEAFNMLGNTEQQTVIHSGVNMDTVQKIAVQIPNGNSLESHQATNKFGYWDVLDKSNNPLANMMGELVMYRNFEIVSEEVQLFRESDDRDNTPAVRALEKLNNPGQFTPQQLEDAKSIVESMFVHGAYDYADPETVKVTENGILKITLNGWYDGDCWLLFKYIFDNETFAYEVLAGEYYFDGSYIDASYVRDLIGKDDVTTENWAIVKNMIMDVYNENTYIEIYNEDGDIIEDAESMNREQLEPLVSAYYTWLMNKDTFEDIDSAFTSSASRVDDRNTESEYYNEITGMIASSFNVRNEGGELVLYMSFGDALSIASHMDAEDEGVIDDESSTLFDIDEFLSNIDYETNQRIHVDPSFPYFDENIKSDFNSDLSEYLTSG